MKCSVCGQPVGNHVIDPRLAPNECMLKVEQGSIDWYIHPSRVFGMKDAKLEDFLK